ncbi:MAG: GCN5-related N-acetyltransferase [Anaerosolibacter sp.]|jgi:N-acetylglutamate synthase-like GNAT family acetyltransferase|uniref:GNAT family N-acetyltransferase n=1 Tax=Anaerosolibacter sp. TaxID=1872527 RepID=UPI00261F3F95|nr:GNAT family N-acetyltransferase [Anaerosolibacter sp.]MDF2545227.1 GCN5-related N-acetyltransferase [Anaerosolibacter sp.]
MSPHLNQFTFTSDSKQLDLDSICTMLNNSYWASTRTKETIERSMKNSLCFAVFSHSKQIGFARVVTDQATFAYLCDVYIDENYRGYGLGKSFIQYILDHPDLCTLRKWLLRTKDAHGLYAQFDFQSLKNPEIFMERTV